jgi:hypothetical protein
MHLLIPARQFHVNVPGDIERVEKAGFHSCPAGFTRSQYGIKTYY